MQRNKLVIYLILFAMIVVSAFVTTCSADFDSSEDQENQYLNHEKIEKSLTNLKNDIDKILSGKNVKKTKFSVSVYSLDTKQYYYRRNPNLPLTPASNTKLVTTFSALYILGEDYQVKTGIYTNAKSIKDSIIDGDLFIYGRGDALFSESDLIMLIKQLHNKGIRHINGNIYADGSYFDKMKSRKTYSHDKELVEAIPPITALSIEKNLATILMFSGSKANALLRVSTKPHSAGFVISNKAKTKAIKRRRKKSSIEKMKSNKKLIKSDESFIRLGDSKYRRRRRRRRKPIRVTTVMLKSGKQKFNVRGYLYQNRNYSYRYFMQNPELVTAGALMNNLIANGIRVDGNIGIKKISTIKNKKLLIEFSRPLIELVNTANKESDNYIAETIFKIIGAYAGNRKDNAYKSISLENMIFDSLKINHSNCRINDGSGLSRRNKLTTDFLVNILIKSYYLPLGELFINTLPIAGIDGTLYKRMINSVAEDNLIAKTGTLRQASALAGIVTTMDGETLLFAFMFNGPYVYNYKMMEDKLGILLASFSYYYD